MIAMKIINKRLSTHILIFAALAFGTTDMATAQENNQKVRLALLEIDSTQLEQYKAALKEEVETSILLEPGVLTLYAVMEKENPTHITILEIYADEEAYKTHLETPHFIKYKTLTNKMVKSLKLVETVPLVPEMKIK
jgi:4-carboxymuconolactone decarboxylase